jgi:hypothetical protein
MIGLQASRSTAAKLASCAPFGYAHLECVGCELTF